jgi:hypothetical protein
LEEHSKTEKDDITTVEVTETPSNHESAEKPARFATGTEKIQKSKEKTNQFFEAFGSRTRQLASRLDFTPSNPHARKAKDAVFKLATFIGPGAIISVAYIDPDNYQTAISAGALFQYKLLFMVLLSNLLAIYLQVRP